MEQKTKDPGDILDYVFDFAPLTNGRVGADSDFLESGETIDTFTVAVDAGIAKDSDSKTNTNTSITVVLSDGTAGEKYRVNCEIVTQGGSLVRTVQRSMMIKVVQK